MRIVTASLRQNRAPPQRAIRSRRGSRRMEFRRVRTVRRRPYDSAAARTPSSICRSAFVQIHPVRSRRAASRIPSHRAHLQRVGCIDPAHLLFASRDAGRACAGDSGEPAAHRDLSTTQRYMHLSPAAIQGAIRLLDQAKPAHGFGSISNDVGDVKTHDVRSGRRSRLSLAKSRRRAPVAVFRAASVSTLTVLEIFRSCLGVAHQTSLRSLATMMTVRTPSREAGCLLIR